VSHELSSSVRTAITTLGRSTAAYVEGMAFIVYDTGRDPSYFERHLLSYLAQDFLQSALAIPLLVREGILSTARRELRFILEASIKLCYIQQLAYSSPIDEKVKKFRGEFTAVPISQNPDGESRHFLGYWTRVDRIRDQVGGSCCPD
jgi:hypothetical protein